MKNLRSGILVLALLMGAAAPTFAQEAVATEVADQDAKKQEITMKELPSTVVEDIKTNHPDAKFVSAVKHLGADGQAEGYKVVLNQGGEEVTLKYDAKGVPAKK